MVGKTAVHMPSCPCVMKVKGHRILSRTVKQNWHPTLAQLTVQLIVGRSENDDVLFVYLCQPSVIVNYVCRGPENTETGPWISGRELPGRMKIDWLFYKTILVLGCAAFQGNIYYAYVLAECSRIVVSVTLICSGTDYERCGLS
ncbi:hypothetical protein TNCV_4719431 [Trichonephila clavipes]|uniref:Uncharacterized protein n=1 Tax=Trichonephila clavipes TaxID=2585209 RepID=A0A8X6W5S0_TRICX|nr:hypothetical protein TNCV_4719431 [Trichonephila clavipes]